MVGFIKFLIIVGVFLSPLTAKARNIEPDRLAHAYHYVWSSCANCGPNRKGLHYYISQVVFAPHNDYRALGGSFFDVVRNMPHAAPNGHPSSAYTTYEAATQARRKAISRMRSKKWAVHYIQWATRWTGNHGPSRRFRKKNRQVRQRVGPRYRTRYKRRYRTRYKRRYRKRYRPSYRKRYRRRNLVTRGYR